MGEALVQIPTQKRPLPIERDKPVRALFMKFHFIPPWQPFKQWLWGNVPLRMSNNSQDQQLFSVANTLIKRVKIFLPESIKDCFMKDTCKQEQNEPQTKEFCPKDATFVSYHNQFPLCATAETCAHDISGLTSPVYSLVMTCYYSLQYRKMGKTVLCLVFHYKTGNSLYSGKDKSYREYIQYVQQNLFSVMT